MYIKRKIDKYLIDWKNDSERKPLVIKGARQIGKTKSILRFAKKEYQSVIYINFAEEPQYKSITDSGFKAQSIIYNISFLDPSKEFIPNKTIIIFDEIQDFVEIMTSLKFFKLDGRFDIICSGSLLGVNYNRIESVSVGYKTDYEMTGIDFEEFLLAKGYNDEQINDLLEHMVNVEPLSQLIYDVLSGLFLDYIVLGGMPDVVKTYLEKQSFEGSLAKQRQIIKDYKEDITKYADGVDKTRILNVFNHIPVQLASETKKFQKLKKMHVLETIMAQLNG